MNQPNYQPPGYGAGGYGQQQPSGYGQPPPPKKRRVWLWVLVIGTALLLGGCIVLIGAVAYLTPDSPKSANSTTSSESMPADKRGYIGDWRAEGMTLSITSNGYVTYKRQQGGKSKSISNLPIQEWQGNDFVVGVWIANTTFKVSQPPHQVGGVWKITVDGMELTKGGTASSGVNTNNTSDF